MTQSDARVAQLEAALAEAQATIRAQADALRAATRRLEQEGAAQALLAERREAARLKKQRQRSERIVSGVSRDRGTDVSPGQWRDNGGTPLPPPLDGSPPPSIPSSPSPLSSPPSLFPPPSSAALELRLEPQEAPRQARKARPKPEKPPDPRHVQLTRDLCEVQGWPHHGGRTAKAIVQLLELAAQAGRAPEEVLRRAAFAREHEGFPRVRELHELVTHWGHFAEPSRGTGPPRRDANDGIMRPDGRECAGCGYVGEGAGIGAPTVWLSYACGCVTAWSDAELDYSKAAEWAERRRHAG